MSTLARNAPKVFLHIVPILFYFFSPSSLVLLADGGPERLIDHFPEAASSGCMACHQEVEPIREVGSEMLNQIMAKGKAMGDPAGCVVCHNGDPNETQDVAIAHGGANFYPDPGSPWVNAVSYTHLRAHET